jgi:hypothetical protein
MYERGGARAGSNPKGNTATVLPLVRLNGLESIFALAAIRAFAVLSI